MRHKFFATVLTATLAVPTAGWGAPFFTSRAETPAATAPAPAESQGSRWRLASLWNKSEAPAAQPHAMYQGPVEESPSAGSRIASALKNNPLTRAWGGDADTPQQPQLPKEVDTLSLNRPTGPPTPELLVSMAQLAEAQGNAESARGLYARALTAAPRHAKILREAGHFEDRQGNLAAARSHYQQAVSAAPNDPSSLNDLALCLARQGELRESAGLLNRAIQLNPQKARYRNNMATVLMEMGDQQGAMQQLLAAHPPAVAHYNMGHLLMRGSHTEAAAGHFAEATRLDPSMEAAQVALAQVRGNQSAAAPSTAMANTTHPATAPSAAPATTAEVPRVVRPLPTVGGAAAPQAPSSQGTGGQSTESDDGMWPSQPITPTPSAAPSTPVEPSFGPRLLPPVR